MKLYPLALITALAGILANGCAAADPTQEGSEDELRALTTASEVAGTIEVDMSGKSVTAPSYRGAAQYRAFKFEATKGQKLVAYVVANNGTDPIAYLLDDKFKTLVTNDDRDASVKDAEVRFTVPKNGSYYLAFRNKEQAAATFMTRIAEALDTGTRSYADGWPEPSRSDLFTPYPNYDVTVTGVGGALVRDMGCLMTSTNSRTRERSEQKLALRINLQKRTVSVLNPRDNVVSDRDATEVIGRASIRSDGSFTLDQPTEGGFGRATGRLAAGGLVVLNSGETQYCYNNFRGDRVADAQSVSNAVGSFNRWE
jgi:hypothetical protein